MGELSIDSIIEDANATPAAMPDWSSLGSYFEHVFAQNVEDNQPIDYAASQDRFDYLSARFNAIAENLNIDPAHSCVPASEAWTLSYIVDSETVLSTDQYNISHVLGHATLNSQGHELVSEASIHETIICAVKEEGALGVFHPSHNLITLGFQVEDVNDETQILELRDVTNTVLYDWGDLGQSLRVLSEELAHAAQYNVWRNYNPLPVEEGNDFYSRPDEKMWGLFSEAHAKVIAANVLIEKALPLVHDDGSVSPGSPQLLSNFLEDTRLNGDAEIIKTVMALHLKHGRDSIEEDPSLLWPAYEKFFSDPDGAALYYDQMSAEINKYIDPDDFDQMDISEIIEGFGQIPGLNGNALEEDLKDKTPADIAQLLPKESELARWLNQSFQDVAAGVPVAPLAPELQPVPIPQENPNIEPSDIPTPEPRSDDLDHEQGAVDVPVPIANPLQP